MSFSHRRETSQQERVDAALTRLNTLLTHPDVRDIVGQEKTTIDFGKLLSQNKIILLKLSANLAEDVKKFIGTILLSELVFAVRDRPEDKRSQFCVFIDEFHNFASTDHMAVMTTEGRKFGVAATYLHVERFGQLAHNQKLMGATAAIVNKGLFQSTVNDADEFAPEFAKRVEPTEIRREAELVLSPNPVEDIWDRGHPNQLIMGLRQDYFWIVDLLRNRPTEKYFLFDPSHVSPDNLKYNPPEFTLNDFEDQDYYRVSADMLHNGIAVINEYFYNWMRGKYDPNEIITEEQVEITIKMIECLGGVLGFLPMMRPHIPNEKRERLLYLMNEKLKRDHEQNARERFRQ